MSDNAPSPRPVYLIDQERMEEMYRLAQQDRILTSEMGGPLPERGNNFVGISDILDLACGSGGWLLDIARHHPEVHCMGVDLSERMVEFNTVQAEADELTNTTFRVADLLQPLDLPDQSFDLVNARLIIGFMLPSAWPQLLNEVKRILRPGGIVRVTECEAAIATSPTFSLFGRYLTESMYRLGRSFSADGRTLSTTAVIGKLLRDAGFAQVSNRAYALEFSAGTPLHQPLSQDFLSGIRLAQPFLTQQGLSDKEFNRQFQQMEQELASDDMCGIWHYVTWTGVKPSL